MMRLSVLLWLFCVFMCFWDGIRSNEIQFDRIELNPLSLDGFYNASLFRIAKFNHTAYALNADGDIFTDVDQNFDIEINFYYNRMNNNQYIRSPLRVPKGSLCNTIEKYYRTYVMKYIQDYSNLPQYEPPATFCPLKQVNSMNYNAERNFLEIFHSFSTDIECIFSKLGSLLD